MTQIDPKALEAAAKAVFECHRFNPDNHPWVEGGNSFKQQDARRLALAAIEASRAALPPPGDVGELVKRLRVNRDQNDVDARPYYAVMVYEDDRREAADALQSLSARLAEVEREKGDAAKDVLRLTGDLARMQVRADTATARAERLAAALRPLVEACESDFTSEATEAGVGRERDDEPVSFTVGGIGCSLAFGHIRAGRAALATPEPQG